MSKKFLILVGVFFAIFVAFAIFLPDDNPFKMTFAYIVTGAVVVGVLWGFGIISFFVRLFKKK